MLLVKPTGDGQRVEEDVLDGGEDSVNAPPTINKMIGRESIDIPKRTSDMLIDSRIRRSQNQSSQE